MHNLESLSLMRELTARYWADESLHSIQHYELFMSADALVTTIDDLLKNGFDADSVELSQLFEDLSTLRVSSLVSDYYQASQLEERLDE